MSSDGALRGRPSLRKPGSASATPQDLHHARPSEQLAWLKQELANLEAYCSILKGALAAAGIEAAPARHPLLAKLRRQEAALVGILFAAYPRVLHAHDILQALPGRDHAEDRVASLVPCKIVQVRKLLGRDAIESVRGEGYRLGRALHERLRGAA